MGSHGVGYVKIVIVLRARRCVSYRANLHLPTCENALRMQLFFCVSKKYVAHIASNIDHHHNEKYIFPFKQNIYFFSNRSAANYNCMS